MSLKNKTDKELWDILDKIDSQIIDLKQIYDNDIEGLKRDKDYIYQEMIKREKEQK